MATFVNRFEDRKVVEYFNEATKVCIWFDHGLMDVIAFMPVMEHLRTAYPKVHMDIGLRPEYCALFDGVDLFDEVVRNYDYVFQIAYSGVAGVKERRSKNRICCEDELGIKFSADWVWTPLTHATYSPFIAVDFTSSLAPDRLSCSRQQAEEICSLLRQHDYIPLDVHYFELSENYVPSYSFIENSVTQFLMNRFYLFPAILQQCYGFVGVLGDSWALASRILQDNCLTLQPSSADVALYVDAYKGYKHVDIESKDYLSEIDDWLDYISGEKPKKSILSDNDVLAQSPQMLARSSNSRRIAEEPRTFKLKKKNTPRVIHV